MKRISEADRLQKLTKYDSVYWNEPGVILGGMDEVGRGPLAGPVCVACVIMPQEPLVEYVNDSKKLTQLRREKLYPTLLSTAIDYSIAWTGPEVIDEMNILEATKLTFKDAFLRMKLKPTDVLIDALSGLGISAREHPLIHGDALSYSIGAASVIAKVSRDRYMAEQDKLYPEYNFAKNKGYGTAEHIAAIKKYGPCPIHRRTFIKHFINE